MEYTIISGYNGEEVGKSVSEKLAEGWELSGELKIAAYFANTGEKASTLHIWLFAQALIKQDKSSNDFVHG